MARQSQARAPSLTREGLRGPIVLLQTVEDALIDVIRADVTACQLVVLRPLIT